MAAGDVARVSAKGDHITKCMAAKVDVGAGNEHG